MDVTVQIGPEDDDRSVSVTIADDDFSPDVFEMVCTRATVHALFLYRELHPTPLTFEQITVNPTGQAEIRATLQHRLGDI